MTAAKIDSYLVQVTRNTRNRLKFGVSMAEPGSVAHEIARFMHEGEANSFAEMLAERFRASGRTVELHLK